MRDNQRRAFTLIELLIVVAIIAILAAIAVPNFLEAQTRSKVSRVKADQRTMSIALESYFVDHNNYAANKPGGFADGLRALSTPVSYISDAWMPDPFGNSEFAQVTVNGVPIGKDAIYFYFNYWEHAKFNPTGLFLVAPTSPFPWWTKAAFTYRYQVSSAGPIRVFKNQVCNQSNGSLCEVKFTGEMVAGTDNYDPSNGTKSWGLILRTAVGPNDNRPGDPSVGGPNAFYTLSDLAG